MRWIRIKGSTFVVNIVINGVLEDQDGPVGELLRARDLARVQVVQQRGQVHRVRDDTQVVPVGTQYTVGSGVSVGGIYVGQCIKSRRLRGDRGVHVRHGAPEVRDHGGLGQVHERVPVTRQARGNMAVKKHTRV